MKVTYDRSFAGEEWTEYWQLGGLVVSWESDADTIVLQRTKTPLLRRKPASAKKMHYLIKKIWQAKRFVT